MSIIMIELNNEQLEKLKQIEMDILIEVDRICRLNDIKYSLAFGTLLGAVRHKGFIPWDDDVDIMMSRNEFEKFTHIVKDNLSNKFHFVDMHTDKYYSLPFPKVMAKNSLMKEVSISKSKVPDNVFIDIFVFDRLSPDINQQKKQLRQSKLLRKILLCRGQYFFNQKGLKKYFYRIAGLLCLLIPKKFLTDKFDAIVQSFNETNGKWSLMYEDNALTRLTLPEDTFNHYTFLIFEGHEFLSIKNYHSILEIKYGDYMKLPPKNEQLPHHFVTEFNIDGYFDNQQNTL